MDHWYEEACEVNGVLFDRAYGMGNTPHGYDVDYFGFQVLMRPRTFMDLVSGANFRPNMTNLGVIRDGVQNGQPIAPPFLNIDLFEDPEIPPSVRGHEGRHRMTTILALVGDEPVPVHILLRSGGRARNISQDMIEKFRNGAYAEDEIDRTYIHGPLFDRSYHMKTEMDYAPVMVPRR